VTRRILASFLAVLVGVLVVVVVPLGSGLSSLERADFGRAVRAEARAQAAIAEERLGDAIDTGPRRPPTLSAEPGDGVVLLDPAGRVLATAGRAVAPAVVAAARTGRPPAAHDAVVSVAAVGETSRRDGIVVLVRDAEPLDRRIQSLWLGLAAAGVAALALGALVATALARWIGRPLRTLRAAALQMGDGDVSARAGQPAGPPEIRRLASAFDEMADRIGSLLESQRIMTADVSHQLRTPLSALRLRLELLADDAPPDVRAELSGALHEIGRLSRLADGLLAVARAEAVSTGREPVDVAAVVAQRVDLWAPAADERGVALEADVGDAVALATPGHLEQVVDNLVANAVDALAPGRAVTVGAHTEGDHVLLTVVDDGEGMSEQARLAAFTRFAGDRPGPSKSGLGLAIVARLVAADHGTAKLDETPGGGLTVVVSLPRGGSRPAR
jgi:signal transduction histidine kinase